MATEKRKIYNSGPSPNPECPKLLKDNDRNFTLLLRTLGNIKKTETTVEETKLSINLNVETFIRKIEQECGDYTGWKNKLQEAKDKLSSCYYILCPQIYIDFLLAELEVTIIEVCITNIENKYIQELKETIKKLREKLITEESLLAGYKTAFNKYLEEGKRLIKELIEKGCIIPPALLFEDYTKEIKSIECNKSKEKIKKLKKKYFKLFKDMFDIKFGLNGIKILKIKQKNLIESKPMIEEVIKKIEDVKRYVVGTEDEAQFFIITSKVKAVLAQNIKEQSLFEANLKNILIKKEKTNNILKRTKKLLDLKIKQSIKLCN
jgi:hypothetical protein